MPYTLLFNKFLKFLNGSPLTLKPTKAIDIGLIESASSCFSK